MPFGTYPDTLRLALQGNQNLNRLTFNSLFHLFIDLIIYLSIESFIYVSIHYAFVTSRLFMRLSCLQFITLSIICGL